MLKLWVTTPLAKLSSPFVGKYLANGPAAAAVPPTVA